MKESYKMDIIMDTIIDIIMDIIIDSIMDSISRIEAWLYVTNHFVKHTQINKTRSLTKDKIIESIIWKINDMIIRLRKNLELWVLKAGHNIFLSKIMILEGCDINLC